MRAADINLKELLSFHPDAGKLLLSGERMVLFNHRAMQTLHELLERNLGPTLRRAFLAQFGYRCGLRDYETVTRMADWETDVDRLASGPVMHTWEGIVHVTPTLIEYDREAGRFHMKGEWRNSYEAAIQRDLFGTSSVPACHSLTGYASGWGSEFFASPVIAIETACEACGDPHCEFELRDIASWDERAEPWIRALKSDDHTLARELENRVHQRTFELETTMGQLEVAVERAETANRAKSVFLASTTHELRTPVAAINGLCEVLAKTNLDDEQRRYLELIRQSSDGLLALVNDVLDLSKIEAGKMSVETTSFDLHAVVHRCVALLTDKAEQKQLTLHSTVDPSVPRHIEADPSRLQQILLNLIANAVKFTATGSVHVGVSTRPAIGGEHLLVVEVTDTGIGIDEASFEGLFCAFTQADASTSRQFGGTGLGLTISRQLARLMGGDLTVKSQLGQGSRFTVTLMVRETATPGTEARTQFVEHPHLGREMPLRILLVEDNRVLELIARKRLSALGYVIDVASSGKEALARAANKVFDLVLMDIRMPVMDGIETTRRMREMLSDDAQPFIAAMTADAVGEQRKRCLDAGMNEYLVKPTAPEELVAVLKAAYNARHPRGVFSMAPPSENQRRKISSEFPRDLFCPELVTRQKSELGEDLYEDVLHAFKVDAIDLIDTARRAAANVQHYAEADEHMQTFRRAMHTLRSTSLAVGAKPLSEIALRAESANTQEFAEALARVDHAVKRVVGFE